MTSPASVVTFGPVGDGFSQSQRAVWASLPISLTQEPAKTRLAAIDGQSPGWLGTLADTIRSGAAGILVVEPAAGPSALDIRAAAVAAADAKTIVAVQSAWAASPAVAQFTQASAGQLAEVTLIDSVIQLGGTGHRRWDDVLLGQLTLLRVTTGPLELTWFTAQHENGYTLDGAAGTSTVTLAAVRSAPVPDTARLTAYAATGEAHLVVPADGVARPAAAWFVGPDGAVVQPAWYETASRASWRRLHHAATERPGEALPDLAGLARDIELLAGITARWTGSGP